MSIEPDVLIREKVAALQLGIHVNTLIRLRRKGLIGCIEIPGGKKITVRYRQAHIDAFKAANEKLPKCKENTSNSQPIDSTSDGILPIGKYVDVRLSARRVEKGATVLSDTQRAYQMLQSRKSG